MAAPDAELLLRRQLLLARSAALRVALAEDGAVLERPLATADRFRAGARWLHRRRDWVAVGALVVLVLRPRRAWRLVRLSWGLWRSARRARPWLAVAGAFVSAGVAAKRR